MFTNRRSAIDTQPTTFTDAKNADTQSKLRKCIRSHKGRYEMVDREKVIKGLECLAQEKEPAANPCKDCGYISRPNFAFCIKDVAVDALELLKEQEAVKPKVIGTNSFGHPVHACGECGLLITESMNYCHECGKRIEWESR